MMTTCRPTEIIEEAAPRFSFIGSMTAMGFDVSTSGGSFRRVQKVIDIAGNRLPCRFIDDLGEQLGLSCLISSVQLRG